MKQRLPVHLLARLQASRFHVQILILVDFWLVFGLPGHQWSCTGLGHPKRLYLLSIHLRSWDSTARYLADSDAGHDLEVERNTRDHVSSQNHPLDSGQT